MKTPPLGLSSRLIWRKNGGIATTLLPLSVANDRKTTILPKNWFKISPIIKNFEHCGNFRIFLSLRFFKSEINFGVSKSAKSAIFTHLEALNFDLYEFLHFLKDESDQINKCQSLKMPQMAMFRSSRFFQN